MFIVIIFNENLMLCKARFFGIHLIWPSFLFFKGVLLLIKLFLFLLLLVPIVLLVLLVFLVLIIIILKRRNIFALTN